MSAVVMALRLVLLSRRPCSARHLPTLRPLHRYCAPGIYVEEAELLMPPRVA